MNQPSFFTPLPFFPATVLLASSDRSADSIFLIQQSHPIYKSHPTTKAFYVSLGKSVSTIQGRLGGICVLCMLGRHNQRLLRLAIINSSKSPSRNACVFAVSWPVRRSLIRPESST